MNVRDIMTAPPVTLRSDTPVAEVARILLEHGLSGAPVVDGRGRLIGLVSRHHLVTKHARPHVPIYLGILGGVIPIDTQAMDEEVRRALATTARELMDPRPHTVSGGADVTDAADLLVDEGVSALPVMEDGILVGIVGEENFVRLLMAEESGAVEAGS